jgi:hypothetical protein
MAMLQWRRIEVPSDFIPRAGHAATVVAGKTSEHKCLDTGPLRSLQTAYLARDVDHGVMFNVQFTSSAARISEELSYMLRRC